MLENKFGIEIEDPHRWLEESQNNEVKEWINQQNKFTFKKLRGSAFDILARELAESHKHVQYLNPTYVNGRYFLRERQPGEDQFVLYYKENIDGEKKVVVNPNGMNASNTITLDFWEESTSGKYVAYGLSEGGDEMATLYIKDIDNDKILKEQILNCRYSEICWLNDDSGFYYTSHPKPGQVPKDEEHLHEKVYFHKLGDEPGDDNLIFGEKRPKDDMISLSLSPDDKYLAIHVSQNWTEDDIYLYDTASGKTISVAVGIKATFEVGFLNEKILIQTNLDAPNNKVLYADYRDVTKPITEWGVFIPENKNILTDLTWSKSKIFATYLVNASNQTTVLTHDAVKIGELKIPEYSTIAGVTADIKEEEYFYAITSFTIPRIIYRHNPDTKTDEIYQENYNPLDPADYVVKQEWCKSRDGEAIPIFIVHQSKLDLDSRPPTILYGYGGFGSIMSPFYFDTLIPWLKRGGVFALANIRGGGEFGEAWHQNGIKDKKQNSFNDFIAAAEYLTKNYTSSERLGIMGASNGGLLVSAVATQRPELFKAVVSEVPLTDMARFHKFGMALRWTHEYGNPDQHDDLQRILEWSPYHNIKENVRYPHFLITTAENDTRVHPMHARKLTARLQEVSKNTDVLLYTETEAGHGAGKPVKKLIEGDSLILSFLTSKLGLKI